MESTDLSYAAGFFDGEGCISVYPKTLYDTIKKRRVKLRHLSLTVTATNTNKGVIEWFVKTFGGTLSCRRYTNHYKDLWYWTATGRSAAAFLALVEPYLQVKKEQANAAIMFAETMSWPLVSRKLVGGAFLSPEAEHLREMAYRFLHANKIKGRRPKIAVTRVAGKAVRAA